MGHSTTRSPLASAVSQLLNNPRAVDHIGVIHVHELSVSRSLARKVMSPSGEGPSRESVRGMGLRNPFSFVTLRPPSHAYPELLGREYLKSRGAHQADTFPSSAFVIAKYGSRSALAVYTLPFTRPFECCPSRGLPKPG